MMMKRLITAATFAALLCAKPAPATAEDYLLNFRDADIRAMIDDISMMTGRTFIIDPRVRANVTIISRDPVEENAVFDLFLSALRVYGFTAVSTASGAYKIVPDEAAVQDGSATRVQGEGDDVLISQIFRIRNVDPLTVLNTVKPLVHRQGRAIAHRTQDFILVVDYRGNMDRIRSVIAEIDQDMSITRLISLENISAEEAAKTLTSIRGRQGGEAADTAFSAIPVLSSNTLVLKGDPAVIAKMEGLVTDLDARGANRGDIRVVYLRHANAEQLTPVLEKVTRTLQQAGSQSAGNSGASTAAGRASIDFHAATNSLIISASADVQRELSDVIRQLDIPRSQVLVEAIIVEASDDAARDLGFQYVLSGGEGSNIPFTATNFSNTAPNILAATGALAIPDGTFADGVSDNLATAAVDSLLGLNGFTGAFAGTSGDTLFGVIFNALERDTQSNILSTPFVMTLDNQTASLISGQEIPVTTGEALGSANVNAFRTVERIEVGIKLTVTPHINEDGHIRMQINQEVSSVLGPVGNTLDLITNKRSVDTTITVNDGEVIVLGGLLEENEAVSLEKVPFLGDIPGLGRLFQSESKSLTKTNLMVFLRPTIVRNASDTRLLTDRKLNIVRETGFDRRLGGKGIDYILNDFTGRPDDTAISPATNTDNN